MSLDKTARAGATLAALLLGLAGSAAAQSISETTRVAAPNPEGDARLGNAADVDGDTLILGAPRGNGDTGTAYVFVRNGTSWDFQAQLVPSSGFLGAWFGGSVAVEGDRAVVGARRDIDSTGMIQPGRAYVFERTGTTWTETAVLEALDAFDTDWFGQSVDLSGDTIVVGSNFNQATVGFAAGAAYVFVDNGTAWAEQTKLIASDATGGDFFGWDVAVDQDTIVVGSEFDDDNGSESGSAYVFTRSGIVWTERTKLAPASGAAADDQFGVSVDIENGTIVVGAIEAPFMAPCCTGSAYVFTGSGATWSQEAQLTPTGGAAGDLFGSSVSLDGDTLAVGAINSDVMGTDSGAAYVFSRVGTVWSQDAELRGSNSLTGDLVGDGLGLSGGVVVAGAPYGDQPGFADAGAAYVYDLNADSTPYCQGKINSVGCVPFISSNGTPSATATTSFAVRANDAVPAEAGILLYSFKKANLAFHGGTLCVKAPFVRTPAKSAKNPGGGCSGWTITRNFNNTIQSGNDPALTAGKVVRAQWRQRDPADPAGFGDSLTNGLQFTIQP